MAPKGGQKVISMFVRPLFRLSVRLSQIIFAGGFWNIVDVQRTLHFDLDPSMTTGQSHEILRFCEFICLTGSSLCSLLLRNYSTKFSNADAKLPREQCRFATHTSF